MVTLFKLFVRVLPVVLATGMMLGCVTVSKPSVAETQESVQNILPAVGEQVLQKGRLLDAVYTLLEDHVRRHPGAYGAAFAVPVNAGQDNRDWFCPYVFRRNGRFERVNLVDQKYNYPGQDWFKQAKEKGKAFWSEPYYDEGGGNIWMITYSLPLFENGNFAGVITTDLPVATR